MQLSIEMFVGLAAIAGALIGGGVAAYRITTTLVGKSGVTTTTTVEKSTNGGSNEHLCSSCKTIKDNIAELFRRQDVLRDETLPRDYLRRTEFISITSQLDRIASQVDKLTQALIERGLKLP